MLLRKVLNKNTKVLSLTRSPFFPYSKRHLGYSTARSLSTIVSTSGSGSDEGGNADWLKIGDISSPVREDGPAKSKIPRGYDQSLGEETLRNLRWMMQKDQLGQDMFLIGPPGPNRRWLAMLYAQLLNREVEVVAISRDSTESDLKQRREIIDGNAIFIDQAPVRAALNGRLLILDGIEKAERNVLPTLNNLLENREMQLEDGRFIMSADRYDQLLSQGETKESLDAKRLVRAHDDFLVVALGIPVPPYPGKPLDPPLRSRFQARVVDASRGSEIWNKLVSFSMTDTDASRGSELNLDNTVHSSLGEMELNLSEMLKSIAGVVEMLRSIEASGIDTFTERVEHFPETALPSLAKISSHFPHEHMASVLGRAFPMISPISSHSSLLSPDEKSQRARCMLVLEQFGFPTDSIISKYRLKDVDLENGMFCFMGVGGSIPDVEIKGAVGDREDQMPASMESRFFTTEMHEGIISAMAQDHCFGRDILIVGGAGSGKSELARQFSKKLGYSSKLFSLYKDMTARDLLQRRTTDGEGNTGWDHSPLVKAALNGDMLILDGVDRLDPDTITVIERLINDREVDLYDGNRLVSYPVKSDDKGLLQVHPNFRIVALATSEADKKLLTGQLLSMFSTHHLNDLTSSEHALLIKKCFPNAPQDVVEALRKFMFALEASRESTTEEKKKSNAAALGLKPLSTRQVTRLARTMNTFPETAGVELREHVRNILLAQFLPQTHQKMLDEIMDDCGFGYDNHEETDTKIQIHAANEQENIARIGDIELTVEPPTHPELVPSPLFFEIPSHKRVLRDMLESLASGEKHLLLIGNQGVGKNKLADYMCKILGAEREYIQLHRDSTVGSVTLSPGLKDGLVVFEDSPLVRAAIHGRILLVDEADKAPLEVVSVLKSLVEDKEMMLADGRRLVSEDNYSGEPDCIPIHPNFKMWALANRRGFPFLGNDFFREVGDIFCPHVIDNPDMNSELNLLSQYAPGVDAEILVKLVKSFSDLRILVQDGVLTYPYSTREAVAVAKHLEAFPDDGLVETLENVLGFDSYNSLLRDSINEVFQKNDIPLDNAGRFAQVKIELASKEDIPPEVKTEEWKY